MPIAFEHDRDGGWHGVFFNLQPDDPEYTIGFMRTLEPSESDRELGQDKVCVTYFGATAYGCVTSWEQVDIATLRLGLTRRGADLLGLDEVTEFACDDVDDITDGFLEVLQMLQATGELPTSGPWSRLAQVDDAADVVDITDVPG